MMKALLPSRYPGEGLGGIRASSGVHCKAIVANLAKMRAAEVKIIGPMQRLHIVRGCKRPINYVQ